MHESKRRRLSVEPVADRFKAVDDDGEEFDREVYDDRQFYSLLLKVRLLSTTIIQRLSCNAF